MMSGAATNMKVEGGAPAHRETPEKFVIVVVPFHFFGSKSTEKKHS